MSNAFIGEIRMFGGNYAPQDWAFCNGQLLPISQNDALFSLIGTTYGGDGRTTFAVPDLRGRLPLNMGTGQSTYRLGENGGVEEVTLTVNEMPAHTHALAAASGGQVTSPANALPAAASSQQADVEVYGSAGSASTTFNPATIGVSGEGRSHGNVQPYLCVSFIICLYGIYPSRN